MSAAPVFHHFLTFTMRAFHSLCLPASLSLSIPNEQSPAYKGKAAAICSASPGALGGLRGLVTLRSILGNIGVTVLPDQVCISTAHEAFDDAGKLRDERKAKQVAKFAADLVSLAAKLKA
jgi:NAD(P)H-dependent FMN reductase